MKAENLVEVQSLTHKFTGVEEWLVSVYECANCKASILVHFKFCPSCGKNLLYDKFEEPNDFYCSE